MQICVWKDVLSEYKSKEDVAKGATMLLHQVELHILNENSATPKKDENPSWDIGKKLKADLLQCHKEEWDMEHS